MSIACLDVGYHGDIAQVAGIVIAGWQDSLPVQEKVLQMPVPAPYMPGAFYLRELPCLTVMLKLLPAVEAIVIDGYVWLDGHGVEGLGAHLHNALQARIPVIGVAKKPFRGSPHAQIVLRGESTRPLYVTTAGTDDKFAARHVQAMYGKYRIPEVLKRVDYLTQLAPESGTHAASE